MLKLKLMDTFAFHRGQYLTSLQNMMMMMMMTMTGVMVRLEGRVPRHQTALLSADASCKQFKFTIQNCYDERDDDDDDGYDDVDEYYNFNESKPASYCLAVVISAAISLAV